MHWTEVGDDAPNLEDEDRNGVPDGITALADALNTAESDYLAEGWRALVGDLGEGGSDAIDVYVRDIDVYGYSHPVPGSDGWSCFLELDSDLSTDGGVAQSVAVHELHHCVEFRYTTDVALWVYEAAATYEQYTHVLDPALEYALGFLYTARLGSPERRLSAIDGRYEYGGFLWMKFWSERGGFRPGRLPELWERLGEEGAWEAGLDAAAEETFDLDLPRTFLEHAVWNAFACGADDGRHYVPDVLPCLPTVTVPSQPWDGAPVDLAHEEGPFTAAYLELAPDERGAIGVTCDGVPGVEFGAVALDAEGVGTELHTGLAGDVLRVELRDGPVRVVVVGTDAPLAATCEVVEAPPEALFPLRGAVGCSQSAAPSAAAPALLLGLLWRRRPRRQNAWPNRR